MSANPRSKVGSAAIFSLVDVFLRQGAQFFISIILARLLAPEDFGKLAIISIFYALASAIASGGISWAIIKEADLKPIDEYSAFWTNMLLAVISVGILSIAAQTVASYYNDADLKWLMLAMMPIIFISALGAVPEALLSKNLNMQPIMVGGAISVIVSGALAIILARNSFGTWALVAQMIVAQTISTSCNVYFSRWRPKMQFSGASLQKMYKISGHILINSIIEIFYMKMYSLVIGKVFGPHQVGIYFRSESLALFPSSIIVAVFGRISFPYFSGISNDRKALSIKFIRFSEILVAIHVFTMVMLFLTATPLIFLILGPRWVEVIPIFKILCLSGTLLPMQIINNHANIAIGNSGYFFIVETIKKIFGICVIALIYTHGAEAIAWGFALTNALFYIVGLTVLWSSLKFSARAYLWGVVKVLFSIGVAAAVMTLLTADVQATSITWQLVGALAAGTVAYLLMLAVTSRHIFQAGLRLAMVRPAR